MLLASGSPWPVLVAGWRLAVAQGKATAGTACAAPAVAGAVAIPLQILAGDLYGLNTLSTSRQDRCDGRHLETERGAPLCCSMAREKARPNAYARCRFPGASLILTHDADAELQGSEFRPTSARGAGVLRLPVMVGTGLLMLAVGRLRDATGAAAADGARPALLSGMTFSGWVARGHWYVTEIGRQPFIV